MGGQGEVERIRVQVPLRADDLEKIDDLAQRMGLARGAMVARLVEMGLDDNEWLIRGITTRFMAPVKRVIEQWNEKGEKKRRGKKR